MDHVCVPPSKIRDEEKSVQQKSEYRICPSIIGNIPVARFVSCSIFRTFSTACSSSAAYLESTTQSTQYFARTSIIPKVPSVWGEIRKYQCRLQGCRR